MNQEQSGQELPPSDRLPQRISEGMIVYDSAGDLVGTVQVVYFGGASEEAIDRALHSETGGTDLSNLPEEMGARLMKQGYVLVDGPDLTGAQRYLRAEQIEGVFPIDIEGTMTDVARLRVTREELLNS
jgi:hypothetical protein